MAKYIIHIKEKPFLTKDDVLTPLDTDKVYEVIEKKTDTRTIIQNASMWKYYSLLAEALNGGGYDVKTIIKGGVDWTKDSVHEYMWKPIQKALLQKESTTLLKKDEIDVVYQNMDRLTSEKFGIHIDFPSKESLIKDK